LRATSYASAPMISATSGAPSALAGYGNFVFAYLDGGYKLAVVAPDGAIYTAALTPYL